MLAHWLCGRLPWLLLALAAASAVTAAADRAPPAALRRALLQGPDAPGTSEEARAADIAALNALTARLAAAASPPPRGGAAAGLEAGRAALGLTRLRRSRARVAAASLRALERQYPSGVPVPDAAAGDAAAAAAAASAGASPAGGVTPAFWQPACASVSHTLAYPFPSDAPSAWTDSVSDYWLIAIKGGRTGRWCRDTGAAGVACDVAPGSLGVDSMFTFSTLGGTTKTSKFPGLGSLLGATDQWCKDGTDTVLRCNATGSNTAQQTLQFYCRPCAPAPTKAGGGDSSRCYWSFSSLRSGFKGFCSQDQADNKLRCGAARITTNETHDLYCYNYATNTWTDCVARRQKAVPKPSPSPTPSPSPSPPPSPRLQRVPLALGEPQYPMPNMVRIQAVVNNTVPIDQGLAPITVAVIDTGVDKNHPDLNVIGGIDYLGENAPFYDGYGHGTHVAGTIGAKNNGVGVYGVMPGVKIYSLKMLNSSGDGSTDDIVRALEWVASEGQAKHDIWVINMSIGGDQLDTALCASIDAVVRRGMVAVVAAGNDGDNMLLRSPGDCAAAIAATNLWVTLLATAGPGRKTNWLPASASDAAKRRVVAAPGSAVWSTLQGNQYGQLTGTSMAAPHVSGVAARCFSSGVCKRNVSEGRANMDRVIAAAYDKSAFDPSYRWTNTNYSSAGRYYGPMIWADAY